MSRAQAVGVTRPARLGLIALVAVALFVAGIYFWQKFAHSSAYDFGVHFPTAAGVAPGAQVFLSGVQIGTVRTVQILPDNSVDFLLNVSSGNDIPKTARFSVLTTVTGSPTVAIVVPHLKAAQQSPAPLASPDVWPHRVLPVSEQPTGTPPLTIEKVLAQSRALGSRIDTVLGMARPYGKPLMYHLQSARSNGAQTAAELRAAGPQLKTTVQSTLTQAEANVQQAQTALRTRDQTRIKVLATAFQATLARMKPIASTLRDLRRNPQMRQNVRETTAQVRRITANLAALSNDLAIIARNPEIKAELQDAGARFRDILHQL
jgi:ABC-type transporter Mla subunit MlaD